MHRLWHSNQDNVHRDYGNDDDDDNMYHSPLG